MKINEKRLEERMNRINSIAVTAESGMMRLALTDADKEARDLIVSWLEVAGLDVIFDVLVFFFLIL